MKQETQNQSPKRMNPYMGFLLGILIVVFLNGLLVPTITDDKTGQLRCFHSESG